MKSIVNYHTIYKYRIKEVLESKPKSLCKGYRNMLMEKLNITDIQLSNKLNIKNKNDRREWTGLQLQIAALVLGVDINELFYPTLLDMTKEKNIQLEAA